jgi:hypothetical protein
LLADYTHEGRILPRMSQIKQSLERNDIPKIIELLHGLFKTIPSHLFIAKREAYFHSIIYLTFTLLGVYVQSEVNSSDGRLDAVVHTPERLFIFEFKLDESADIAFNQIVEKDYAAAFRHLSKSIIGIGVHLSSDKKGIDGFKTAEI